MNLVVGGMAASSASATHFRVKASSVENPYFLTEVSNCLNLSFCDLNEFTLSGKEYFLAIETERTEVEIQSALKNCVQNKHHLKIEIENLENHSVKAFEASSKLAIAFQKRFPNVFLRPLGQQQKIEKINLILEKMRNHQFKEALELVPVLYGLPTFGRVFAVTPKSDPEDKNPAALNFDESKTISIAEIDLNTPHHIPAHDLAMQNACYLVTVVRHELEHAFQTERAQECKKRLDYNAYSWEHSNDRELSAHFNDMANLESFCPDEEVIQKFQRSIFESFQEYYPGLFSRAE